MNSASTPRTGPNAPHTLPTEVPLAPAPLATPLPVPGTVAPLEPPAPTAKLTPEEQMALFEKDLKENDWGHQPC